MAAAVSAGAAPGAVGQAPVQRPGEPAGAEPAPAGVAVMAGVGPGGAASGAAAAVPSLPANGLAVLVAFGLLAAGTFGAYELNYWRPTATFRMGANMSAFGGLFVFSAAVERLLEPITQWLPGRRSRGDYERMIAAVANRHPVMGLTDVAEAKARMDRMRANRTVLTWGLATGVSTIVAGAAGFNLLHMLAENAQWDGVTSWADSLITGLVVGSGTKPLHDVIARVQKGKERAEDAAT